MTPGRESFNPLKGLDLQVEKHCSKSTAIILKGNMATADIQLIYLLNAGIPFPHTDYGAICPYMLTHGHVDSNQDYTNGERLNVQCSFHP